MFAKILIPSLKNAHRKKKKSSLKRYKDSMIAQIPLATTEVLQEGVGGVAGRAVALPLF